MELRKDPITRSWVVVGHAEREQPRPGPCPLCPGNREEKHVLLQLPAQGPWQVRAYPHFRPLYHIEGDPARVADGIFDRMSAIGAHEIIVETPDHSRTLTELSDEEIERLLQAYLLRIADLKRDARFKYIAVFKNQGRAAGEDWSHSHSQVAATTFVPRRILYELRSAREWYRERDRCVFCDILRQEIRQKQRVVDSVGDYYAFCPYASRVPFETWILPRTHNHQFEAPVSGENRRNLATLLGRALRRLVQVTPSYHMVLHTAPNTLQTKGELSDYWATIAGDYHWHIEILPIVETRRKSYSIKEVYFNSTLPEHAAERLRQLDPRKMMACAERSQYRHGACKKPLHDMGQDRQQGGIFLRLLFLLCFACLVFLIYVVRHPLMRLAGGFWVVDETPVSADAIVILGDDNYSGDRATRAAELFQAGWAPRIVASGRYLRPYASVAELEQHDLTDRGVPQNAIVPLAHRAESTREEAMAINQLISARGWKRVILVTSNYHTRRARYIFERTLPRGTELRVVAARDSEFDPDSWWTTRLGVELFAAETAGMAVALWEMRHEGARTSESARLRALQDTVAHLYQTGILLVYRQFRLYYSFFTA